MKASDITRQLNKAKFNPGKDNLMRAVCEVSDPYFCAQRIQELAAELQYSEDRTRDNERCVQIMRLAAIAQAQLEGNKLAAEPTEASRQVP